MTDTEAMRAILAKAVMTEDDCQYYSMSQPFQRTSEAHHFLRTYMKAAPTMLDEIDALRAENDGLRAEVSWLREEVRKYTPEEIEVFQRCLDRGIWTVPNNIAEYTKDELVAQARAALEQQP